MNDAERQQEAIYKVIEERARQEAKWGEPSEDGWFGSCANPAMSNEYRLAVLIEEVGEVGRAMLEEGDLEAELVQVAAVAVAWVEGIRAELEMEATR